MELCSNKHLPFSTPIEVFAVVRKLDRRATACPPQGMVGGLRRSSLPQRFPAWHENFLSFYLGLLHRLVKNKSGEAVLSAA